MDPHAPGPPPPQMTTAIAFVFYGLMAAIAVGAASWADLDLLVWHNHNETSLALNSVVGLVAGLIVVFASAGLERVADWARRLSDAFADMLGDMSMAQISVFAVTSSVGEELLFRGFLQQWLSDVVFDGPASDWIGLLLTSVIFGLIHVGPDRKTFLPWTIMAVLMGFALGGMYLYTGNVLAPVLCHFTINFLNLAQIARRARDKAA